MGVTRLLLVDDDRTLIRVVGAALEEEGYAVTLAYDGRLGLAAFAADAYDLLVLDVLMPELDGLALCRRIRLTSRVPIIFLTSRADEADRITGLETGADDYLVKPFSTRELVARIRAIGRRVEREPASTAASLKVGPLEIDMGRFEARWHGAGVVLTRSELMVLHALAKQPGFVLSRDRLIDLVKGGEVVITERTIDTFIKRIRQKFHAVDPSFDAVETVIGVGYRLREAAR